MAHQSKFQWLYRTGKAKAKQVDYRSVTLEQGCRSRSCLDVTHQTPSHTLSTSNTTTITTTTTTTAPLQSGVEPSE